MAGLSGAVQRVADFVKVGNSFFSGTLAMALLLLASAACGLQGQPTASPPGPTPGLETVAAEQVESAESAPEGEALVDPAVTGTQETDAPAGPIADETPPAPTPVPTPVPFTPDTERLVNLLRFGNYDAGGMARTTLWEMARAEFEQLPHAPGATVGDPEWLAFLDAYRLAALRAALHVRYDEALELHPGRQHPFLIDLLEQLRAGILGHPPPDEAVREWLQESATLTGDRGYSPYLVNYEFYFSGLEDDPFPEWDDFVDAVEELPDEALLAHIDAYSERLLESYPDLYGQMRAEELSTMRAVVEMAALSLMGEGVTSTSPARLSHSAEMGFNNVYYYRPNVWQEEERPPYYDAMMAQLLAKQSRSLTVPLCPVQGGCRMVSGQDLGASAGYQIGSTHTGIDYELIGDVTPIIAPLDMTIVQATGTNGRYGTSPRSGREMGLGRYSVVGYLGDFTYEFEENGDPHIWVGDVYANFAHMEPSAALQGRVTALGGSGEPHAYTGLAVAAGDEIGFMGNQGFSLIPHLHFEVIVSWRNKDGAPTANPRAAGVVGPPGLPAGVRFVTAGNDIYLQTGDIFAQLAGRPVPFNARYQWPFGPDVEYIKLYETYAPGG